MIEETIMKAISTVGFPIVAFLLMYYQSTKTIRENTKVLSELVIELKRRKK